MKQQSEVKQRFKLYKSGKLWLVAGIAVAMLFINGPVASAAMDHNDLATLTAVAGQQVEANAQSTPTAADVNKDVVVPQPAAPSEGVTVDDNATSESESNSEKTEATDDNEQSQSAGYEIPKYQGEGATGWQQMSDGRVVYFNEQGQMIHGEANINNQWYFFNQQGTVAQKWVTLPDGRKVYYDVQLDGGKLNGQGMFHGLNEVPGEGMYFFNPDSGALETGLRQVAGKTYYFAPKMVVNKEAQIDGHWYFFDKNGEMATGFVTLPSGKTVLYKNNGQMAYGEQYYDGHWYYLVPKSGELVKEWVTLPDGRVVYYGLNKDGNTIGVGMYHGEHQIGDQDYYFNDDSGERLIGFKTIAGKKYYFAPQKLQKTEQQINGHWYYFNETGEMTTGFVTLPSGKTVYYDQNGQMVYGEVQVDGHWYYLVPQSGELAKGFQTLPDKRVVYYDTDPKTGQVLGMVYGKTQVGVATYYFNPASGAMEKGLRFDNATKKLNYYDNEGKLQSNTKFADYQIDKDGNFVLTDGEHQIKGQWYLVKGGQVLTGWQKLSDNRLVYYDLMTAQMVKGERQIDGYWYYFNPASGEMATGLTKLPDGRIVYYGKDGHMKYGEQQLSNSWDDWHYFRTDSGAMVVGWFLLKGTNNTYRTVYYDQAGRMVHGFTTINGWLVHFDEATGDLTRSGYIWDKAGHRYRARPDGGLLPA